MSNELIEAFHRLTPSKHRTTARGWITFDCPACSDRRGRGGFVETPTGGFRYRCQNGGCRYEQKTGWEPGSPFLGRPRRLFEMMGGDVDTLPQELVDPNRPIRRNYDMDDPEARRAWIDQMMSEWSPEAASTKLWRPKQDQFALEFPTIKLPKNTVYLWDAKTHDALDVQQYAVERCKFFLNHAPLLWCPKYKRHVIIPLIEKNKFIGWIARKIDAGKEYAHIKAPNFPSDYMLNQNFRYRYPDILVVQGAFDALALRGLCTFGNVVSKKQINLLNHMCGTGKRIVLVPDFKKDEWRDYWNTAKENGWYLSVPDRWGGSDNESPEDYIKDPGDSIKRHGLLYTLETVMNSITNDYLYAETTLLMRVR